MRARLAQLKFAKLLLSAAQRIAFSKHRRFHQLGRICISIAILRSFTLDICTYMSVGHNRLVTPWILVGLELSDVENNS